MNAVKNEGVTKGLVGECYSCAIGVSEPEACARCLTSSGDRDIVTGVCVLYACTCARARVCASLHCIVHLYVHYIT